MTPTAAAAPRFLVVDDNDDHRFLLAKTLLRHFPSAILHECADEESAFAVAESESLSAIVAHRSHGLDGVDLVRRFRAIHPRVIILLVSGVDRSAGALAAGATRFLLYDEWLRVGLVVAELMAQEAAKTPPPAAL